MKMILAVLLSIAFAVPCNAQNINRIINAAEVNRIEAVLASDSLQGRKVFTPGIDKAADFISAEFKKAGLKTFKSLNGYKQSFNMLKPQLVSLTASADGVSLSEGNVIVISTQETLAVTEQSKFDTVIIGAKDNFFKTAINTLGSQKNTIVFADSTFKNNFKRLSFLPNKFLPPPQQLYLF